MKGTTHALHIIFRAGCSMCLIGHGIFGIITKPVWCNYFALFNIDNATAYELMPYVGAMDIMLGVSVFCYPVAIVIGWLAFWGLFTALLRPWSGESIAEFFERAGNYGMPFIWLMLAGLRLRTFDWLKRIRSDITLNIIELRHITFALQVSGFLLMMGHGWLNLIEKEIFVHEYMMLGFSNAISVSHTVGLFEILAACLILVRPNAKIVFVILLWKAVSEMFYPTYGAIEWIERGGSYAVLLALWIILHNNIPYSFSVKKLFQKNKGQVSSCHQEVV